MKQALQAGLRALLAACALVVAAQASAAEPAGETLKAIKARNAINIGYLADAFPMSFTNSNGEAAGYSIDFCRAIADEVARATGLTSMKVQYVPLTTAERFDAVANGKVDIECGTSTMTLTRMKQVDFTNTIFLDGGSFLVKKGSAIGTIPALVDETIAVIPGTTTEKSLRQMLEKRSIKAKVVEVKSHSEGMAALESGKVSVYASDRVLLVGLLLKSGHMDNFAMMPEQFSYEPYGFAVRRNDADFRLVANTALAKLSTSGAVYGIFDRWFGAIGKPNPGLLAMYLINSIPD